MIDETSAAIFLRLLLSTENDGSLSSYNNLLNFAGLKDYQNYLSPITVISFLEVTNPFLFHFSQIMFFKHL